MAWVSEGRVRVSRAPAQTDTKVVDSNDPARNWVEINEPGIAEQSVEFPPLVYTDVLKEIKLDGVIITTVTMEGQKHEQRDNDLLPWNKPRRLYETPPRQEKQISFSLMRSTDDEQKKVRMSTTSATPETRY